MAKEKTVKEDKVSDVVSGINSKFGAGTMFKLGERKVEWVPVIPTGIIGLDAALGVGGLPLGRIVEIMGPQGSGKSSICISTAAQAQKLGYDVAYIDVEYALNTEYAEQLGVDINNLFVSQPDSAEKVFEVIEALLEQATNVKVIIVDSVDAMITQREMEADFGDSNIGIKAKLMSQAMRRLKAKVAKANVCLVFVNQLRDVIGAMGYAETTITTGGKALGYYADVRITSKRTGKLKGKGDEASDVVGHKTLLEVIKNKVAPPFKKYEYEVTYGDNNFRATEMVKLAVDLDIIHRAGAFYSFEDGKWQGATALREALEDADLLDRVVTAVKGNLGLLHD